MGISKLFEVAEDASANMCVCLPLTSIHAMAWKYKWHQAGWVVRYAALSLGVSAAERAGINCGDAWERLQTVGQRRPSNNRKQVNEAARQVEADILRRIGDAVEIQWRQPYIDMTATCRDITAYQLLDAGEWMVEMRVTPQRPKPKR